jgi:S-adenosylmethionine hydrolase
MPLSVPRPIITLTTDFGSDSAYVAQMKGVILSRNPDVCLLDISHSIPPQDLRRGAIMLADACPRFPARTIHVAVVDPGVGTERALVFAQIGTQRFVAPNNGLLTVLARRTSPSMLVQITNSTYFLPTVSPTFHGRDILAPVAAHLSLGLNPQRLGQPLESLLMLSLPNPVVEDQQVIGQIWEIDPFGNLITNILWEEIIGTLTTPERAIVRFKSATIIGLVTTYANRSAGELVAVIGSSGRLELAIVNGNAAQSLSASVDDPVVVSW